MFKSLMTITALACSLCLFAQQTLTLSVGMTYDGLGRMETITHPNGKGLSVRSGSTGLKAWFKNPSRACGSPITIS